MEKICFFCGNTFESDTYETIVNYHVCPECKAEMDKGITLLSVQNTKSFKDQIPICKYETNDGLKEMYPTGEWAVFPENAIHEFFGDSSETTSKLITDRKGFIAPEIFNQIKEIYKDLKVPERKET